MIEPLDISRDKDWTIIKPKFADSSTKVHFSSPDALKMLGYCVEPMIAETRKKIEERVPECGWFENFSACNVDTREVFYEPLDFSVFVERDLNVEGSLLLGLSVVKKNGHEFSTLLMFGKQEEALDYLNTAKAQIDIKDAIERLLRNL